MDGYAVCDHKVNMALESIKGLSTSSNLSDLDACELCEIPLFVKDDRQYVVRIQREHQPLITICPQLAPLIPRSTTLPAVRDRSLGSNEEDDDGRHHDLERSRSVAIAADGTHAKNQTPTLGVERSSGPEEQIRSVTGRRCSQTLSRSTSGYTSTDSRPSSDSPSHASSADEKSSTVTSLSETSTRSGPPTIKDIDEPQLHWRLGPVLTRHHSKDRPRTSPGRSSTDFIMTKELSNGKFWLVVDVSMERYRWCVPEARTSSLLDISFSRAELTGLLERRKIRLSNHCSQGFRVSGFEEHSGKFQPACPEVIVDEQAFQKLYTAGIAGGSSSKALAHSLAEQGWGEARFLYRLQQGPEWRFRPCEDLLPDLLSTLTASTPPLELRKVRHRLSSTKGKFSLMICMGAVDYMPLRSVMIKMIVRERLPMERLPMKRLPIERLPIERLPME